MALGQYKQGRAAIEQASRICEAMGARRSLAFDLMNLGETYLATGDLRTARQFVEKALQEISPSQDARGNTFALNGLGNVLLAEDDVYGAVRRFTEGREMALRYGLSFLAFESLSGLAACAVMQGRLDESRNYITEVWDYLKEHGWLGMSNPGKVYRTCAETFDALGEDENARAVIESGHQALMDVAEKINVPAWRQSFLENVPDHRAIMEMWERRKQ